MAGTSIPKLREEWERLRIRYGIAGSPPELDRLLLNSRRKQARLRDLRDRRAVLEAEIETLETEVSGLDKTLRHFLNDVIRRAKVENGDSWSPTAVLGFRVWMAEEGGFHGYRQQWDHRSLRAECGTTTNQVDVPHTQGECGSPPCGIYAAKDVGQVIDAHGGVDPARLAVGLVAMTGKVVEHERGYRAEEATVLALAFLRNGGVYTTREAEEIELLFQGIGHSADWNHPSVAVSTNPLERMVGFMNQEKEKRSRWILESPNEL